MKFLVYVDKLINDKLIRGRWETISGRCYRRMILENCFVCKVLCFLLDKIDKDHCKKAYINDRQANSSIPGVA